MGSKDEAMLFVASSEWLVKVWFVARKKRGNSLFLVGIVKNAQSSQCVFNVFFLNGNAISPLH